MDDEIEAARARASRDRPSSPARISRSIRRSRATCAVELEHRRRDVDHGDPRSGRGVERAVLAAAGGEAEHVEPVEPLGQPRAGRAVPAAAEPAARVVEGLVGRRPRERHSRLREAVPATAVVVDRRRLLRGPPGLTHGCDGSADEAVRRRARREHQRPAPSAPAPWHGQIIHGEIRGRVEPERPLVGTVERELDPVDDAERREVEPRPGGEDAGR